MKSRWLLLTVLLAIAAPAFARENLGVFSEWGAFRDPELKRCYAIAMPSTPAEVSEYQPFASIGTWPERKIRGQVHLRLSRAAKQNAVIRMAVGGSRFILTGGGGDAWAKDKTMDAAIVAAMRSASTMSVSASDATGARFTDRYNLEGAATAMDAATIGCSKT